jgi:hypothetical protein
LHLHTIVSRAGFISTANFFIAETINGYPCPTADAILVPTTTVSE